MTDTKQWHLNIFEAMKFVPIVLGFLHDFNALTDSLSKDPDHPDAAPIGHDLYPWLPGFIKDRTTLDEFVNGLYDFIKMITKPKQ